MGKLVGRPGLDSAGGSDPWPTAEKAGWNEECTAKSSGQSNWYFSSSAWKRGW
jgi:hypothetical protein